MDDLVTIEYRGIAGVLPAGSSVTVESSEAGVLRLRGKASPAGPAADDLVTVEHRGVSGVLVVGDSLMVESCAAGVLYLRKAPPPAVQISSPGAASRRSVKGKPKETT